MRGTEFFGFQKFLFIETTESNMHAVIIQLIAKFLSKLEIVRLTTVSKNFRDAVDVEFQKRYFDVHCRTSFHCLSWRQYTALQYHYEQNLVSKLKCKSVIMCSQGSWSVSDDVDRAKEVMSSKTRALVHEKCQRLFELSFQVNLSLHQVRMLTGRLSAGSTAALLEEHTSLMQSIEALRATLSFEGALYDKVKSPVLMELNGLVEFHEYIPKYEESKGVVLQLFASLDGTRYVPLTASRKLKLQTNYTDCNCIRYHPVCGTEFELDDNTIRYQLCDNKLCVNAMVSNSYLQYLFNPFRYVPHEWKYIATVNINGVQIELPIMPERVLHCQGSPGLEIYFRYGDRDAQDDGGVEQGLHIICEQSGFLGMELHAQHERQNQSKVIVSETMTYAENTSRQVARSKVKKLDQKNTKSSTQSRFEWIHPPLPHSASQKVIITYGCRMEGKGQVSIDYIECTLGFDALLQRIWK